MKNLKSKLIATFVAGITLAAFISTSGIENQHQQNSVKIQPLSYNQPTHTPTPHEHRISPTPDATATPHDTSTPHPVVSPTTHPTHLTPHPTATPIPEPAPNQGHKPKEDDPTDDPKPGDPPVPPPTIGDDVGDRVIKPLIKPKPSQQVQCPAGTPQVAQEFQSIAAFLQERQGIDLGCPVTSPTGNGQQLRRYQLFRSKADPNIVNSAEWHSDDACVYVAYTPSTSPLWYSTDRANQNFPNERVRPGDNRGFNALKSANVSGKVPSSQAFILPGWSPAPRWFKICGSGSPQTWTATVIGRNTSNWSLPRSGSYCYWDYLNKDGYGDKAYTYIGGPPEWHTLLPADYRGRNSQRLIDGRIADWGDIMSLMQDQPIGSPGRLVNNPQRALQILGWDGQPTRDDVYSKRRVPWFPSTTEGVVRNSFLAGEDYSGSHREPPRDYWLGIRQPASNSRSGWYPADCGLLKEVKNALCNDWDIFVDVDPEYQFMLANRESQSGGTADRGQGNFNNSLRGNLEVEMEQWLWPMGYRPESGDRIYMVGRWIIDCGHDNWAAELHPLEMYVSSHIELIARVANNPTTASPFVKVAYSEEPQAQRSQISASVVVTDAWPGGTLEFDVWAPPRPSVNAKLRYTTAVARDSQLADVKIGLTVTESQEPAGNPNRVHVTVTSTRPRGAIRTNTLNDVYYLDEKGVRRYVARYILWWETPKSIPKPPQTLPSERP